MAFNKLRHVSAMYKFVLIVHYEHNQITVLDISGEEATRGRTHRCRGIAPNAGLGRIQCFPLGQIERVDAKVEAVAVFVAPVVVECFDSLDERGMALTLRVYTAQIAVRVAYSNGRNKIN